MLNTFDRAYCINLDRRPDRWKRFQAAVPANWPFAEIERFTAVDGDKVPAPDWWRPGNGAWGCYRSHLQLIEQALNEGRESILILEDDALFDADFAPRVRNFLARVPDDWGMLYFGGQHLKAEQVPPRPINEEVCIPHNVNRTHAFALRGETMQAVYRHLTCNQWQVGNHIDHHLGQFLERRDRRFPVYCPTKWLVGQAGGESNVTPKSFPNRFWNAAAEGGDVGKQPFVAIVGLHASGSSALAGMVWSLGVFLGNRLGGYYGNRPGTKCGYEDPALSEICESIIPFPTIQPLAETSQVDRLRDWIKSQQAQAQVHNTIAGGKYPQLCRLGDALQEICGDQLRLIVSQRDLEKSIRSLQRRAPATDPQLIEAHQRWLWDGLQDLRATVPASRQLVVRYEELLDHPENQAVRITEFLDIKTPQLDCRIAKAAAPIHMYAFERAQTI